MSEYDARTTASETQIKGEHRETSLQLMNVKTEEL